MQQEIVVMTVVSERRGVMQRSASVNVDRVCGFWKPACQVPKSGHEIFNDVSLMVAALQRPVIR